jgi:hypothetical protein
MGLRLPLDLRLLAAFNMAVPSGEILVTRLLSPNDPETETLLV